MNTMNTINYRKYLPKEIKPELYVDGDILLYQIGFGFEDIKSFDLVELAIDGFFARLHKTLGIRDKRIFLTGKGNFRDEVAVTHKYKGTRKQEKPKWYNDIREYMIYMMDAEVIEGMEADDMLSICITSNPEGICCSRDKDLRTTAGQHYAWGTRTIPEKPLQSIEELGYIELNAKRKLLGGGKKFLYAQALMGDKVDNIIGIPRFGDVKAFKLLEDATSEWDLYERVRTEYIVHFEDYLERLHENMNLLYMIRELDENGYPVGWSIPDDEEA